MASSSNRQAQLTLFIIVGILILIAAAITLYVQQRLTESGGRFAPVADEIPTEFAPLGFFIQNCLKNAATEGLQRIGLHGGYIGLTAAEEQYTGRTFDRDVIGDTPTAHGALSFTPGSGWDIPYWYHLASDNRCVGDCQFALQRPPLYRREGPGAIESQLDGYVRDRFMDCVGDWNTFSVQGFSVQGSKPPEVRTIIGDRDVTFALRYPLTAQSELGVRSFSNFATTVQVNLLAIYNLATEILNAQVQGKFLEANTMNVIASMSGLNTDIPPLAATEFTAQQRYWQETDVQQRLQQILAAHLQRMTVMGTKNFVSYQFADPIQQGVYQNFMLPLDTDYPELEATFTYLPIWPTYFDAGAPVISTSGSAASSVFSWLPIKQYNTPYDISYPVVIDLSQPDALDNKGFTFAMALEVNIRNNNALTEDFVPLQKAGMDNGQLCDLEQRNSGDITIQVQGSDGVPAQNAAVFFSAGTSCLLGSTDAQGRFVGKFPIGIGALTVTHPDSFAVTRQYATKLDHADTVTIELPRVVTKPIHVVKKNLIKNEEWVLDPQARALEENEKAIITVERIRTSPYEEEFVETTMLTGEETADLRLVPGTYRVNVELIASDTFITIPRKEVGNLLGSETIPAVQVAEGTFHAGTMRLEDWVVTPMQLAQDNQLRFSALNFALAEVPEARRSHKDLEVMGRFGQYVQEQRAEFIPRFEAR